MLISSHLGGSDKDTAPQLLLSKCFHVIAIFSFRNAALGLLISLFKDGETEAESLHVDQMRDILSCEQYKYSHQVSLLRNMCVFMYVTKDIMSCK